MSRPASIVANPHRVPPTELDRAMLLRPGVQRAWATISDWYDYAGTPLHELGELAQEFGVACLMYKDESERFGLGSFKALGGAYAVATLLMRDDLPRDVTVCAGTLGNHGLSVAWGAHRFGCSCVIYLPRGVPRVREQRLRALGAEIVHVAQGFDEAVSRARKDADTYGWYVISYSEHPRYPEISQAVLEGYTVMAREIVEQLAGKPPPTHLFVQCGAGALAASLASYVRGAYGAAAPRVIAVEPDVAGSLYASVQKGESVLVPGAYRTRLVGLASGHLADQAWKTLRTQVDFVVTIADEDAFAAMRMLARKSTTGIAAGESGAAGLAGLMRVAADPDARKLIGLDASSRVVLIGSEGPLDPELYARVLNAPEPSTAGRPNARFDLSAIDD